MKARWSLAVSLALALSLPVAASAQQRTEIDPVRLAAATVTVGHLLPPETFARVM